MKYYLNKNLIKYLLLVTILLVTGCSEWKNEYDFRNHLRDKHPYSKLTKIDLDGLYDYRVDDTLNNKIYIYTSLNKRTLKYISINVGNEK